VPRLARCVIWRLHQPACRRTLSHRFSTSSGWRGGRCRGLPRRLHEHLPARSAFLVAACLLRRHRVSNRVSLRVPRPRSSPRRSRGWADPFAAGPPAFREYCAGCRLNARRTLAALRLSVGDHLEQPVLGSPGDRSRPSASRRSVARLSKPAAIMRRGHRRACQRPPDAGAPLAPQPCASISTSCNAEHLAGRFPNTGVPAGHPRLYYGAGSPSLRAMMTKPG